MEWSGDWPQEGEAHHMSFNVGKQFLMWKKTISAYEYGYGAIQAYMSNVDGTLGTIYVESPSPLVVLITATEKRGPKSLEMLNRVHCHCAWNYWNSFMCSSRLEERTSGVVGSI